MSIIDDLPRKRYTQGVWRATIASTATDESDLVEVVIPGFSPVHRFGGCRWMPRGIDMPARGDFCLVVKDNNDDWWILAWWPKEFG